MGSPSCALIFEDDYDSEFRYAGRPVPALQGLDQPGFPLELGDVDKVHAAFLNESRTRGRCLVPRTGNPGQHGLVLFAGSFSKVLFPSLRLGYLVIPPDLVDSFAAAKSVLNRHAAPFEQTVLCDFITEGHFGRHLRRMREVYAERRSVLMESARRRLTGLLELSSVEAGLQTVGWLCQGIDSAAARRAGASPQGGSDSPQYLQPRRHAERRIAAGFRRRERTGNPARGSPACHCA